MTKNVLNDNFSEPLNGVTAVKVDINTGDGNLIISRLADEKLLASGALEYLEKQGKPTRSLDSKNGKASLALKAPGGKHSWFHFPWSACNGATEWQIHLNPTVSSDITAHSNGGNVNLDLTGMTVTQVSADTGGGNMTVVLPDQTANISVAAKSGAGNVTVEIGNDITGSNTVDASSGAGNVVVHIPNGLAARIQATSGLGKVIVDSRFTKIEKNTYQSSDFDNAANKIEILAKTGAGNVNVNTK